MDVTLASCVPLFHSLARERATSSFCVDTRNDKKRTHGNFAENLIDFVPANIRLNGSFLVFYSNLLQDNSMKLFASSDMGLSMDFRGSSF